MHNFLTETRESGRDGWQVRARADLNSLALEEGARRHGGRATHLLELLRYWEDLRRGRWAPQDVFMRALPAALRDRVSYIDVTCEDPRDFRFVAHQPNPIEGLGDELSGRRIREFPIAAHAKYLAAEYRECCGSRAAHYSLIDQQLWGIRRRYLRLMVPLCDLDGAVTKLAYTYRSLQRPRFTDA
jgi:hypothetical protein